MTFSTMDVHSDLLLSLELNSSAEILAFKKNISAANCLTVDTI